jgi:hypothetical protein
MKVSSQLDTRVAAPWRKEFPLNTWLSLSGLFPVDRNSIPKPRIEPWFLGYTAHISLTHSLTHCCTLQKEKQSNENTIHSCTNYLHMWRITPIKLQCHPVTVHKGIYPFTGRGIQFITSQQLLLVTGLWTATELKLVISIQWQLHLDYKIIVLQHISVINVNT